MKPIIKVENLSKQYRLGTIGTGTLSNDLKRWWHRTLGKEDPFLKIGESNDRTTKGESEYIWALKDINFEVMQGEVLGIIGKNGAGKSTLLKILSKVTGPTTGSISYDGRIGSLLEVGTGFHPELTGRENIFLNGAILGMTKQEIRSKLDEIIDFSGCERYIDTPVKRYSSGMTVRLGFAVAAHLEPEILIVDEVLAVGDAEFQKKAIGKMQDVSRNDGRTVLFVSHNMGALRSLCSKSLILNKGEISFQGSTAIGIETYLNYSIDYDSSTLLKKIQWKAEDLEINSIEINDSNKNIVYISNKQNELKIAIKGVQKFDRKMSIAIWVKDEDNNRFATFDPVFLKGETSVIDKGFFLLESKILFPALMNKGKYKIDLFLVHSGVEYFMKAYDVAILEFEGYATASGQILDKDKGGYFFLHTA